MRKQAYVGDTGPLLWCRGMGWCIMSKQLDTWPHLEVGHGGDGGGGPEVRAVLIVRVKRLQLRLARAPGLVRVLGVGAQVEIESKVRKRFITF